MERHAGHDAPGELTQTAPWEEVVNNTFAEKAMEQ